MPNYLEYVIKPMDLSLLEANVRSKLYGSTDAFMADAKWIQHNCIVFNTCTCSLRFQIYMIIFKTNKFVIVLRWRCLRGHIEIDERGEAAY